MESPETQNNAQKEIENYLNTSKSPFFLCHISIIIMIIGFFLLQNLFLKELNFFFHKNHDIFIGVMSSNSSFHRAKEFEDLWKKSLVFTAQYKIFTSDIFQTGNPNHINLNLHQINKDFDTYPLIFIRRNSLDLIFKFYFVLDYFLTHSKNEYLIRLTDDVFINFNKLSNFLFEIDQNRFLTKNNLVIKGFCIYTSQFFLQGGSGYFFSRKAAIVFKKIYYDLLRTNSVYEDWVVGSYIMKINPSFSTSHSNKFIGHGLDKDTMNQI